MSAGLSDAQAGNKKWSQPKTLIYKSQYTGWLWYLECRKPYDIQLKIKAIRNKPIHFLILYNFLQVVAY